MIGTLGEDVVATLLAPSVPVGETLGARIEVPVTRAIVSYWRAAAYDPVTDLYTVVLDPPPLEGEFNLVWRTGDPEPPAVEVFIPLVVSTAAPALVPVGEPPAWAPSVGDVAKVVPAYTRGGFDDDGQWSGAEQTDDDEPTFTDDTSPTATHVEGLIQAACDEVQGRVAVAIAPAQYGLAKSAARWHVAAMISGGKRPAGTDEASGEYRSNIANFRASLDELVRVARMAAPRLS